MKSLDEILSEKEETIFPTTTPTSSSVNQREMAAGTSAASAQPTCPICQGAGYVVQDLPIGHPDFGKAQACSCQTKARSLLHLERLRRYTTVEAIRQFSFDTFNPSPMGLTADKISSLNRAYVQAKGFAAHPDGWLLFSGTYGCGKTHLAAAIANSLIDQGRPVLFLVVPDLLDHLRSTFGPHSEVSYDELFEQVRSAPVLILDDLGAHHSSSWAEEKLFQILNYRYQLSLPTVITTNQRLDSVDPRLRSRLLDKAVVTSMHIIAPDHRRGGLPERSRISSLHLHRDKTFDNFVIERYGPGSADRENLRKVVHTVRAYASHPQGWLVIMGNTGKGKTHLAAAIANYQLASATSLQELEELASRIVFLSLPEFYDKLKASFQPNTAVSFEAQMAEARAAKLLIIDDIVLGHASKFEEDKLFQLLNYRFEADLATVLSTQHTIEEIETLQPRLHTRIVNRTKSIRCAIR